MSFNNCIFTNGGRALTDKKGLHITSMYNFTISNCLFRNNSNQSVLISIKNVLNVNISGCEFYQNKGQDYLITTILENRVTPFIFVLDNCRIYDNDASISTIDMDGYNSTSIIIVINCLFSNNTSGGKILLITIDRLYMWNIILIKLITR